MTDYDFSPQAQAKAIVRYAELADELAQLEKYLIAFAEHEEAGFELGGVKVAYRKGNRVFESWEQAVTKAYPAEELGAYTIHHEEEVKVIPAWDEVDFERAARDFKIDRAVINQYPPSIKVTYKPKA